MAFDGIADLRHQRWRVLAFLEITAARVEYAAQFLHQEGRIPAFAEDRRDNTCQGHDPLEVVHALGVDENLERTAFFVFGALVEHDIVDGDVEGVLGQGGFNLVGATYKCFRPFQLFVHVHDVGLRRFDLVFLDLIGDDFLINLNGHDCVSVCAGCSSRCS